MTDAAADAPVTRYVDDPDGFPRTCRNLVASFVARLAVLSRVSGGEAVGSELAGLAELGRAAARTSDGARLRRALEASRAGRNGARLWSALRVNDWISQMPPAPVLDHLRNDLAMLLADDLGEVLAAPSGNPAAVPMATLKAPQAVDVLDLLVGYWAWGRELVRAVEAAAADEPFPPGLVVAPEPAADDGLEGPLLR